MTVGIEVDNGKTIGFHIDGEIINGLCHTNDLESISTNCKNFDINFDDEKNPSTKMSKRDQVVIVSLQFSENEKFQFLVGPDLNPKELMELEGDAFSNQFKELIFKAYSMIGKLSLGDLIGDTSST